MKQQYTLVTVAYVDDVGFMHLQARSIARYVPRHLIKQIIVVENAPPALPDGWRHKLKREYGPLADLVKFIPASKIAVMAPGIGGWFTQQVLKLAVADEVETDYYLILDAKNHFVFPLTRECLEVNGKPNMFIHGYEKHPLRRYLEPILHYFGLPQSNIKRMLPTTPPFFMPTKLVREMMLTMMVREQRSFPELFLQSDVKFTEFFTLGAYMLNTNRKFEDYYTPTTKQDHIIWKQGAPDDHYVSTAITRTEAQGNALFSVHRSSFPLLTEASRVAIADFWSRRQLFKDRAAGMEFLRNPNGEPDRA